MWLFTSNGLLSVVQDTADKNYLWIRARDKEHLRSIHADEIVTIPGSDYQYRVRMHKNTFMVTVAQLIAGIDYPKFKPSAKDPKYHKALLEVWEVMYSAYYDEYKKVPE